LDTISGTALRGDESPVLVCISSCLLGEKVRFDGGHKRDAYVVETLGRFFAWHAVCPEVEMGLGTPRETLRLAGDHRAPRLRFRTGGEDITDAMQSWASKRLDQIASLDPSGYILKSDSPSCGMERVRVYGKGDVPSRNGVGIYARALMEAFPLLPVEEEGRLHDMRLRENFVERVFSFRRWRDLVARGLTRGRLVEFHTAHKLLLLSHSPRHYQDLGRLVASPGLHGRRELEARYGELFMAALRVKTTPRRHANVLQHIAGYLKRDLDGGDKAELQSVIGDHAKGLVPLIVPITLIKHHLRRIPVPYLQNQVYLDPHPKELMLRNHV
jgi:uncharacterized protein YbgA (DUF1722 family)/uncharacterized protein YbbK (DUF523 family)